MEEHGDPAGAFIVAGGVVGLISGAVWGGIGGRIAMFILVRTSDERVRGVISDDGFEIGRLSFDSIFLVISTMFAGAIGGVAFGLLRRFLGGRTVHVAPVIGVVFAVVGGALFISAEGIDFHVLDPLWLAMGLFMFLPGAWGATVVVLTDRVVARGSASFGMRPVAGLVRSRVGSAGAWIVVAVAFSLGVFELAGDLADLT